MATVSGQYRTCRQLLFQPESTVVLVFLLTYHALRELGESPSRLKAFTLSIDGGGEDLVQARKFLDDLNLGLFLEAH